MRKKRRTFDEFFPILGVQEGFVISKRGDLTLGWELELPESYSLLEDEYDELSRSWASAVKVLPPWCIVHRQDRFFYEKYKSRDAESFLGKSFEEHHGGREFPVHTAYVFVTFSNKTRISNNNSGCGLLQLMTFRPNRISSAVVESYRAKAGEFIDIVTRSGYIKARPLGNEDYLGTQDRPGLIQRYMMFGREDMLLSDVKISSDEVQVFDQCACSFSLNEVELLPSEVSNTDRVDSLSGVNSEVYLSAGAKIGVLLDCNHYVNSYIVTLPQDATIKNLDAKRKRMVSGSERGADNRIGAEEINDFIEDIQTESRIIVWTHLNVIAFGDKSQKTALRSQVSTALSTMGVTASLNLFDTPVLYYSGIPGAASELGQDNLMTMELDTALCLGCYETFEREVEGGTFRTVDSMRNVPITIDLQLKARELGWIENYNAFVLGGSGTGKSFFMNNYLRNLYDKGESIFLIDVGDSYEGITQVIQEESGGRDGFYFSWDKDHPLSFNPFVGYGSWLDARKELNQDEPGVNAFISSLLSMWSPALGWTSDMKIILNQIVTDFVVDHLSKHKDDGNPVFDDFCRFVDRSVAPKIRSSKYLCGGINVTLQRFDVDSFLISMKPYRKTGEFGFLLNDKSPKDLFTNRWTVFEVDKLSQASDPRFYSLVVLWIMNSFDMMMRRRQEFKVLVIEEAWKAIANDSFSGYIGGLYKTARKFRTSVMTVTQQLSDIMSSSTIRDTILQNSSIRILLDQSANQNNFDSIQELLGLTEIDKNLCLSVNRALNPKYRYKQVFISWGTKKRGVYNTEVSLQEALAFESDKVKKRPVLEKARELGSIIKSITVSAAVMKSIRS